MARIPSFPSQITPDCIESLCDKCSSPVSRAPTVGMVSDVLVQIPNNCFCILAGNETEKLRAVEDHWPDLAQIVLKFIIKIR